jgi:N-acyl-D-aspartate/D-glutamate deacylase
VPPRDPTVSRRLLLLGAAGAGGAAVLARLPATSAAASRRVQVLPAVLEAEPRSEPAVLEGAEPAAGQQVHDLVISGGRVLDPETGFDKEAQVGVDGGTITAISTDGLEGRSRIDAAGLVVAPGFIDLLSYEPNPYGVWFKVADGVTTTMGMHGLNDDAGPFFERWENDPPPVNYGGAFDHPFARSQLGLGVSEAASRGQIRELRAQAERGLAEGWAGVDVEPEYTPGATTEELTAMGAAAAAAGTTLYAHGRYSDDTPPGTNAETLAELLAIARATGTPLHIEHITSTGGTFTMAASLRTLERARDEGVDVTACMYPYDFWATYLGSTRFGPGWQERFHISYDDLLVPGTGERLTEASFEREQGRNTLVAAMAIPEADVVAGLQSPFVMIGSDAVLQEGDNNHPRGAGCFCRVLGRYVRDRRVLSLREALAKMTIFPAQRLAVGASAFARKGRLQVGADADITIFDPATVADRATIADPSRESVGVQWVLVGGQAVKTPDGLQRDVRPGRPIRQG